MEDSVNGRSRLDLEEDISFYQSMINSLEGMKGVEDERENYESCLKELKTELEAMDNHPAEEEFEHSFNQDQDFLQIFERERSHTMMAAHDHSSSRKRNLSTFGEDYLQLGSHKSLKPTPNESPNSSAGDSFASDFFDIPEDETIVGTEWRIGQESAWKAQERKRKQEEEDARLASELAEQWKKEAATLSATQLSRPSITPNTSFTQSSLRPDGHYEKPVIQDRKTSKETTSSLPFRPPVINVESDEDDLQEITASEWIPRISNKPQMNSQQNSNSYVQSNHMPGAFPGQSQSMYMGRGGSSVYGGPSTNNGAGSFFGALSGMTNGLSFDSLYNPGGTIDSIRSLFGQGSSSSPFGLDGSHSRPLPPAWEPERWLEPEETQEEIRQLLKHVRPDEDLPTTEIDVLQPKGLREKLMPHQVKGLAWMRKMEEGTNKGGILADDMGLGKTMQAIALMLENPPPEGTKRPTLIVAPIALIEQWKREIVKMVRRSHSMSVATLHGQSARVRFRDIAHHDVVMTTYGTLTSELKRQAQWEEKAKRIQNAIRSRNEECPMLGESSKFHRIILDEAQWVKNKNTKSAHAVCRLQAEYRWCLSGTPMQNNVEEIYSLIKFCRIRPYCDQEKFNRDIARPLKARYGNKDSALQKLQVLLKSILLRRTKQSQIDGKPILQLPPKYTVEDRAHFNADELAFYQALESKAQITFNRYLREGTVGRNYSHALVLLLRLRQACCSPQLVTNAKDFIAEAGLDGDMDMVANAKELPHNVVVRLLEQEDFECPICMDAAENPVILNPCGHGLCQECLSKMVDNSLREASDGVKCPHCRARVDTKKITDQESFKQVWGPDAELKPGLEDDVQEGTSESETADESSDSEDDRSDDGSDDGSDLRDFIVDDTEVEHEEKKQKKRVKTLSGHDDDINDLLTGISSGSENEEKTSLKQKSSRHSLKGKEPVRNGDAEEDSKRKKKNRRDKKKKSRKDKKEKKKKKDGPASLAVLRREGLRNQTAKRKYIRELSENFTPSAKIEKTLALLQQIDDNGNDEKTIIFSSFTSFLDLLEVPLSQMRQLSYARYDGSMSAGDRNSSVLRFTDDPHCRIILVSIKAGNAGLNLTAANHVIILDPFWNPYVEYQAADRCYRIGQKRDVTIHRVLIGEEGVDYAAQRAQRDADPDDDRPRSQFTVEDRILELQEKKKKLVEAALDENATSTVGRLGTRELGYLFGITDMEGRRRAITNGEGA